MEHKIYQIWGKTFLEQVRTYRYLLTLLFALILVYAFFPAGNALYATLVIDGRRGFYNSTWVGMVGAMFTSIYFSFIGFYFIKNTISHEMENKVDQLIASSAVKKWEYLLGKFVCNVLLLFSMVGVMTIGLVIMQVVRGEDLQINLGQILMPMIIIAVPSMVLVAAIAMLFEVTPGLKKAGNVLFVFAWEILVLPAIFIPNFPDFFGLAFIINTLQAQSPLREGFTGHSMSSMEPTFNQILPVQVYSEFSWPLSFILSRFLWMAVSVGLIFIAAIIFNRFSEEVKVKNSKKAKGRGKKKRRQKKIKKLPTNANIKDVFSASEVELSQGDQSFPQRDINTTFITFSSTGKSRYHFSWVHVLWAKLKLYLKTVPRWGQVLLIGVVVASLVTPLQITRRYIMPAAWLLPIFIWSKLGTLDHHHQTSELINATPKPIRHDFLSTWIVGILITFLIGSGGLIKYILLQEWGLILAWSVGCLFIPSFALMLGTLTKNGKSFEFLYTMIWYIGPINQLAALDYMGAVTTPPASLTWLFYLGCAMLFSTIAWIVTKLQAR